VGLFDRIRDALGGEDADRNGRGGVDRGAGTDRVAGADAGDRKVGSHGSHWDGVTQTSEEVKTAMEAAVQDGERFEGPAVDGGAVAGYEYPSDRSIRTCAVSLGATLATAYPVGDGVVHEVAVERVVEWANGVEAQVEFDLAGEPLGAFDAGYYRHGGRNYVVGDTVSFELSAFAYDLERGEAENLTTESGEQFSTEGMAGVVPFEGGDTDDFVFRSTPKQVVETAFGNRTVYRLRLPLFRDDGEDVDVQLYASDHVTGVRLREGRDVEGVIWLQGRIR
jgi:hypothetical protein